MGKSGIITTKNKRPDVYHNVKALFKIYRSVSWRMQVQMKQVSHQFRKEYGVDEFLDSIYQAGMDLNEDEAYIQARVEAINSSHICPYKPANIAEIIAKVESHLPQNVQINRSTYFRWRDQALRTVDSILWGYEEESRKLLEHYRDTWQETE